MAAVIDLRAVGKRYRKVEEQPTLIRSLIPLGSGTRQDLWALRDIGLEIEQGEAIAVLGHNGSGKTTLLRLLAGVTAPTVGRVRVEGRIGPLISLGVGFHPEMSGRENVLVNGLLLGLDAGRVRERFDQIVEFAELEQFIDTPVKFYSSGMVMRLGFAVMAHTDPTILLVDEVLAVGDVRFQQKCFSRLRTLRDQGATVVMVSHSMDMVRQLCERAVVMRRGRVVYDGGVEDAVALHQRSAAGAREHEGDAPVEILAFGYADGDTQWRHAEPDELVEVEVRLGFHQRVEDPAIAVGVISELGTFGGFDTTELGTSWRTFAPGEEATVRITVPVRLSGGAYRLVVEVKDRVGNERLARSEDLLLKVAERDGSSGLLDVRAEIGLGSGRPAEVEEA